MGSMVSKVLFQPPRPSSYRYASGARGSTPHGKDVLFFPAPHPPRTHRSLSYLFRTSFLSFLSPSLAVTSTTQHDAAFFLAVHKAWGQDPRVLHLRGREDAADGDALVLPRECGRPRHVVRLVSLAHVTGASLCVCVLGFFGFFLIITRSRDTRDHTYF
jgi:hypothetical protein